MKEGYIDSIIDGKPGAVDRLYFAFKKDVVSIIRKTQSLKNEEDAIDLYHRAVIILLNRIKSGKTDEAFTDCKIKPFLCNTCRNILSNTRRKRQVPLVDTDEIDNEGAGIADNEAEEKEKDEMLFVIRSTVRDMKSPCSEILDLSVYQEKKQEEIARIMQYANADVVKTQKARCMKGLRVKVRERLKMMGHEV